MSAPAPGRAALARSLVIDGSILSGSALVSVGVGLISMPAGLISAGAFLLALGLAAARAARTRR
jgi:hypothetical protein